MQKRPQSPSNIPAPIQRDGSSSSIQRSGSRTPRKLPQAIVPTASKKIGNDTRIPTPSSAKSKSIFIDGKTKDSRRIDNEHPGNGEAESQQTGVVYITENMIKKISKEESFHRIFKLALTVPKDLNKKIKYIENLDALKNLQILSIAHNAIEKMERLEKLVNLQILDLSDNLLKKIEGIETLQQLTVLNVEDNLIENIPAFLGKKLKCLRVLKIARNQLTSLYELYKLRGLPDLVELTTQENPFCSFSHHWHFTTFLLRSLEILNNEQISVKDRAEADVRFKQDEIHRLEVELEKSEIRYLKCMENLEKSEKASHLSKQNGLNLEKNNQKLKDDIGKLTNEIETKDQLLESKTKELSKACEKQFKLEQELAFYKLDTKFDEFWKFSGYEHEDDDDQYIDEDQSAYIGKARFKANSRAAERIFPSKAQMINFIKLIRQKDEKTEKINKQIVHDLEEALNVDLEEKQADIFQAEQELERLKSECRKMESGMGKTQDFTDAPQGLPGIEEREKIRNTLANLIQQVKELQDTKAELQEEISNREQILEERKKEIEQLQGQLRILPDDDPDQDKILDTIAAREEQCHQLEKDIDQLACLLSETENEVAVKAEAIAVLEGKLRAGEPTVQQEMKQGLEEMVNKLTNHCEDLKLQMQKQEKLNNDLVKERKLLMGKVEQLESDLSKSHEKIRNADDRENMLKDAYEKLSEKVSKKKRHVGIGSHDVWRDPQVEQLKRELDDSEGEMEKLKNELERLKKQRDAERKASEQLLGEEQSKLDEAVRAARSAGDIKREAKELEKQLQKLQAEKMEMRKQMSEVEENLDKERNDSVPWKSFAKHLQKMLNDIESGVVERDSAPFSSTSHRDRKLNRAFDDLRGRISDVFQQNEEEKEANQKQIQKLNAKVEQLVDDFGRAQAELSEAKQGAVETEQSLNDANQELEQTRNRLRNALNDRSSNERLVKDELDALQARLDEFQRAAGQAKLEANEFRSKLEEADRKMRAVEQLAKEAEMDYEDSRGEVEELRRELKKANDDRNAQAQAARAEVDRLQELLDKKEADADQMDRSKEQLQGKLMNATKRMTQAESKVKMLEHQLDLTAPQIEGLQREIETLKKEKAKNQQAQKEKVGSAKEKFELMQKAFENEIRLLKNELGEGDKFIATLKQQLEKSKDEFRNELHELAEEIAELQAELLKAEAKFQQAEENNNRLLENLAKIEDENTMLNDRLHLLEKQAEELLESERMMHAKELRDLEDELDNMKHLISQLQHVHKTKTQEEERSAFSSLSSEIDTLRQKVAAAEKEALGRELHHRKFKQRLSDEINKLQQAVESRSYEDRLLHNNNQAKQNHLESEIEHLLSQISSLKGTLGHREMELASLRESTQPLIAHFRSRISALVETLQNKEDELNRLRHHLQEFPTGQTIHRITHEPRLDKLANDFEAVKNSVVDLRNHVSDLLSSLPVDGGNSHETHTPLRPGAVESKQSPYPPSQVPNFSQHPSSPIHHHHYGITDELPLGTIISSGASLGTSTFHMHHYNHKEKNKKKRKTGKKTVRYEDDKEDDEFCNVPEHEEMDGELDLLESKLRSSTLTRSRLSNDSPLKMELKHLQNRVEDALLRRHRLKQMQRIRYQSDSL